MLLIFKLFIDSICPPRINPIFHRANEVNAMQIQDARVTVTRMGSKRIVEAVSEKRLFFHKLRKATNGRTPFIIIARTPLDEIILGKNLAIRYTIWARKYGVLKNLSDRFNDLDHRSREFSWNHRGYNWAVMSGHRNDGKLYLKSPYLTIGTTIRPGIVRETIRRII